MKTKLRKLIVVVSIVSLIMAMTSCGDSKDEENTADESAVTITSNIDGEDIDITYEKAPERAVSVAGFMTEMMLDLGLEDRMAGYAYQDNEILPEYKDALAKVPCLSEKAPSQEVLLDAEPDFLTGWGGYFSEKHYPKEFCEANNIKMYMPRVEYPNVTMETVFEEYENLGKIFRVEDRAEKRINEMKAEIQEVEDVVKGADPVSVFVYDSGEEAAFTAGSSLATDMIRRAGGKNIFGDEKENWLTVSWEKIVEGNPDFIIILQYDASDDVQGKKDILMNNPALKDVTAIKEGNIFVLGLSDVGGGPRNPAAIRTMAENFHKELFN